MKKRLVSFLLIISLVLCCYFSAQADEGKKKSGLFSYSLKGNGTAVITGFDWDANNSNDIYVPRLIDGYTVTEIGRYAFSSEEDTGIRKSSIGQEVVVVLPDTISVIGEKAFFCTNVTSVTIPQNCQYIGAGALAGCYNIKNHSVSPENNTFAVIDGVLYNKKTKELIAFPTGKGNAKSDCFSIPEGIVSIGDYAFFCTHLSSPGQSWEKNPNIIIPSSVKSIGEYAFADAYVEYVVFPNVETIHNHAFDDALMDEPVFSSVQSIGDYAFKSVMYIPDKDHIIALPETLESIGEGAFSSFEIYNQSLYSWNVTFDLSKTKVKALNKNAFNRMHSNSETSLTILLPSQLETIGEAAFKDIGKIGSFSKVEGSLTITIPSTVTTIGNEAFQGTVLNISFEDNSEIKAIGSQSFNNAYFIYIKDGFYVKEATVILPLGIQSIGSEAFYSQNLQKLTIPDSVTFIGDNLCDRNITQLEVTAGSYAALYASENGIPFVLTGGDDTSWLND